MLNYVESESTKATGRVFWVPDFSRHVGHSICVSGKVMSDWALFRFCTGHTQNYFAYPKATISMLDLLSVLAFGP